MALEDIAGYSLRRGLGSGSVGAVWLVRDLASGRHAVLKRIPKSAVPTPDGFRDDLARARGIDHPHVARLIEVRQTDREWLIFSQYVAAGTLTGLLQRRGPLSLGELVTLVSPLAQGLAAMHRADLTHARLSTDNIMFDADGRPVLTDPGLRLAAPETAADDFKTLGDLALHSGADSKVFTPTLFTTPGDDFAQHLLSLTSPTPIDLGFPPSTSRSTTAGPATATTGSTNSEDTNSGESSSGDSSSGDNDTGHNTAGHNTAGETSAGDTSAGDTSSGDRSTGAPSPREIGPREAGPRDTTPGSGNPASASAGPGGRGSSNSGPRSPRSIGPGLAGSRSSGIGASRSGSTGSGLVRGGVAAAGSTVHSSSGSVRSGAARRTRSARSGRSTGRAGSHRGGSVARVREGLQSRRSAYGVLAACGVAAVIVLGIGLATVGVLGQPATGSTTSASTPTTASTRSSSSATSPAATSSRSTSTSPTAIPTGRSPRAAEDTTRWLQTLERLDSRRSRAFSTLNQADLDAIYVRGSPPWSADRSLLASYRKQQVRVEGLRMQIETLSVEHPGDETVVLRIVDRLIAGEAVTRSGIRTPLPPGPPTARRMTLTVTNSSWRISAITTT